jgi:hypothetical protein
MLVEQMRNWGKTNRGARMPIADVFDRICGEHARGVDRSLIEFRPRKIVHSTSIIGNSLQRPRRNCS